MNGLRIALITQRFWPLVGGAEKAMERLAVALHELGCRPRIVTAHWEHRWPREIAHREIPVARLPHPFGQRWGAVRYMLTLGRWLRAHRDEIDVLYVSRLRNDAYASLAALGGSPIPVVLRAEGVGETGDLHWQHQATFGQRIGRRCWTADAIVAPSRTVEDALRDAGCPPQRLQLIRKGVSEAPSRTAQRRTAARKSLAECRPAFALKEHTPLAVFIGRLHYSKGLGDLVEAWGPIVAQWPNARLWLVGDGPHRRELKEFIELQGLDHRIFLAGAFDDVEEILQAADLFVQPAHADGISLALLEAMAAGLPVVASDTPGNREVVGDACGILAPPRDAAALSKAIAKSLANPDQRDELSRTARRKVETDFSLSRSAVRHLELFETLVRN